MRGSTRKRGQSWTAYWSQEDPATGERRQRSKGGFKRQKDAEAFLNEVVPKVVAGVYVEPSAETLLVFLRSWLAAQSNVKPLTRRRYHQTIERQIGGRPIGALPLRAISPAHILAFLAELERCGDPGCDHRGGDCRGLAPSTRTVVFAVLKKALAEAVACGSPRLRQRRCCET